MTMTAPATFQFDFEGRLVSLEDSTHVLSSAFRSAVVELDDGGRQPCRLLWGHASPCVAIGDRVLVRRFTGVSSTNYKLTFDDMEPVYPSEEVLP